MGMMRAMTGSHINPTHAEPVFDGQVEGHQLTAIVDGAARFEELIHLIASARSSLRLFYYIYADDPYGARVRGALIDACNRGVVVTLMVDGFGSGDLHDSYFDALIAAGAHFSRFLPRVGRRYLLRNHQKMLIADEATVLIGGANIAADYFVEPERGTRWHDLSLAVTGPCAARLARYYDDLAVWVNSAKQGIRVLQEVLRRHSDATGHLRWLHGGPFQRHSPFTRVLRSDLDRARVVDMIQAYFSPNWSFLQRLGRVARRGRVRIVTAAKSDNATTIGAARHCYPRLLNRRAQIYEYDRAKLHMKLMVIDDVVYIGSANYDTRSLYINVELMLRIEDHVFAQTMRKFCTGEHNQSQAISMALLKRIAGPFRRLRWLIAYFMVSTVDYTITRRLNIQPVPRRRRFPNSR
jgi:cardiolipin synthase A/B